MEETGALKRGHFLYASGRHGEIYLEKFDLLRNPAATVAVCEGFADYCAGPGDRCGGRANDGGVILAFETARQLGVKAAYAERSSDGASGREIRRGTTFAPGTRVLVVDDILTTGGSVRETLEALGRHPVEVVAIGVMVDRSGGRPRSGTCRSLRSRRGSSLRGFQPSVRSAPEVCRW
jgi:orotate phosphoribosyltransferase